MIELVIKPTVPAELLDERDEDLCEPHRPLCHAAAPRRTPA